MALKNISDLASAPALQGPEDIEVQVGGVNLRTTPAGLLIFSGSQYSSFLPLSGDVTGATDTPLFIAADVLAGQGARTVTGESDPLGYSHTLLGSGTYFINASNALMNPANRAAKVRGRVFEGRGSDLTTIVYTGTGPLATNQYWQNVRFLGMTVVNTTGQDFHWSQEQGGTSNIQNNLVEDFKLDGGWNNAFRFTGGNNNSEWWLNRLKGGGAANLLYTPPPTAVTITNGNPSIPLANSPLVIAAGDTVWFNVAVGTGANGVLAGATNQYYVVASSTTAIQVSATRNGTPITFNGGGTTVVAAATDQFLNYWVGQSSFDYGTLAGSIINMNYGGSIHLEDIDCSNIQPTVPTYLINLLNNPSSQGVTSFKMTKFRVEHSSNNSLLLNSNWPGGNISIDGLDQSSQYASRPATQQYMNFNIAQSAGPLVEIANSNLAGTMGITVGSSNYRFPSRVVVRSSHLLQNTRDTYVNTTLNGGVNTGGYPLVSFPDTTEVQDANSAGYKAVAGAFTLHGFATVGGDVREQGITIIGANSDVPGSNNSTTPVRFPLGVFITKYWWWKPVADSVTGSFNYQLQSVDGSIVVTSTQVAALAGANAGAAITLVEYKFPTPILLTSATQAEFQIVDMLTGGGRSAAMTGIRSVLFYLG